MIERRRLLATTFGFGACCATTPLQAFAGWVPSSGQLLIAGFRGTKSSDPEVDAVRRYIAQDALAGVLLLKRNIQSPEQAEKLITSLAEVAPREKPIISIDQEGGSVTRVGPDNGFTTWHSAANLGRSGLSNNDVLQYYSIRAKELAEVGVNLNLAPVVDLNSNPFNPIIGAMERSFGGDVDTVIRFAELFVLAHRSVGVKTSFKHFPGHGSSTEDTHTGTADVSETWRPREITPFERLSRAGLAETMMNSHVLHRHLSDEAWIPTSLSKLSVGEMRSGIGFTGPIIADDMQMKAITSVFGAADAAVRAISVGNSVLIYSNYDKAFRIQDIQEASAAITSGLKAGRINPAVFRSTAELVRNFRSTL